MRNDASGVLIEAICQRARLTEFIASLKTCLPPLARVRSFDISECPDGELPNAFCIKESAQGEITEVDVSCDTAVCSACLEEFNDPTNRRYHHPFINCTDCGPRFTIITSLPYDRPATTMADFEMCDDCKKEYESPLSRRFHAQPICCPQCGPALSLLDKHGNPVFCADPAWRCSELLLQGHTVAIKGLGGFHLACRADSQEAVQRLRLNKMREEKPLALMVRDFAMAELVAHISPLEKALLESPQRPIVVLAKKDTTVIAQAVAPGVPTFGIILPYTPIHHLLFSNARMPALVMTSGNTTDEPIAFTNSDAHIRLRGIADFFLTHNRNIYIRNDDSIVRIAAQNPVFLRRSRGYVPDALPALHTVQGIVALGGVLKSTVAFGRKQMGYISQYIGSVDSIEMLDSVESVIKHFSRILGVMPQTFALDMHPGSLLRSIPKKAGIPFVTVQHHHAHAAACMAENELIEKTLCVVYDGTGYGNDGKIWGGEILFADHKEFSRVGHLAYMPLPGGDAAIKNPGRTAIAFLFSALGEEALNACSWMPEQEKNAVLSMVRSSTNCVETSSMGRLFDAVSAILGVCKKRTYDGQPAIELEGFADALDIGEYAVDIIQSSQPVQINAGAILTEIFIDFKKGTPRDKIAMRFHRTIARATVQALSAVAQTVHCNRVCLCGGCFQNALLLETTTALLKNAGFLPFVHRRTPPSDECIAYGQLVIAGAQKEKELNNARIC